MGQNCTCDLRGRSDRVARRRKALLELCDKLSEQMNVLRFFPSELQERPSPILVAVELGTRMVEHERYDELLDQSECVEIAVSPNLVQYTLFLVCQEIDRVHAGQRLGQKWPCEVQPLVAANNVFDAPSD